MRYWKTVWRDFVIYSHEQGYSTVKALLIVCNLLLALVVALEVFFFTFIFLTRCIFFWLCLPSWAEFQLFLAMSCIWWLDALVINLTDQPVDWADLRRLAAILCLLDGAVFVFLWLAHVGWFLWFL